MLVIVSERLEDFASLAEFLTEHAIYTLRSPMETAAFVCDKYDVGGVLLDMTTRPRLGAGVFERLHSDYPDLPIAALGGKNRYPWLAFAEWIEEDPETTRHKILDFCTHTCKFYTGVLCGTDLTLTQQTAFYKGHALSLSAKQARVLRYLAYRAPHTVEKGELLSVCFPKGELNTRGLAVLIHAINAQAKTIQAPPLIETHYGKGYRIGVVF